MPIVRTLADGLSGDTIVRIDAILNGTTNSVLSRMDALGCGMDEAIADACARGYAEENPSSDLDGFDAATKLSILCMLGFGVRVMPARIDTRSTAGITPADLSAAHREGRTIRQIAHAEYDAETAVLDVWVAPRLVSRTSLFGASSGPQNAAAVTGRYAGLVTLSGAGAGGEAQAVAALSDLVAIARDRAAIVPAPVLVEPNDITGLTDHQLAEAV
jgi:homoserine dehydrogenase